MTNRYARSFQDLIVYHRACEVALQISQLTEGFPCGERYSLADQMRRSSRSIGAHIAEAWGKRRYHRAFISRLTDADAEQLETQHWLQIAVKSGYLSEEQAHDLANKLSEVGKMLNSMMCQAERFCGLITDY